VDLHFFLGQGPFHGISRELALKLMRGRVRSAVLSHAGIRARTNGYWGTRDCLTFLISESGQDAGGNEGIGRGGRIGTTLSKNKGFFVLLRFAAFPCQMPSPNFKSQRLPGSGLSRAEYRRINRRLFKDAQRRSKTRSWPKAKDVQGLGEEWH
jgi:hypothetical protein